MVPTENERNARRPANPQQDLPTGKGGERDAQSPGGIHSDTSNESLPKMYPNTEDTTTGPTPGPGTQAEKSLQREGSVDSSSREGRDDDGGIPSEEILRQRQADRKDNPPAF